MFRLFVFPVTVSGVSIYLLLTFHWKLTVAHELGQVKCMVFVNLSQAFQQAHRTCWEKLEKEMKAEDDKEAKGKGNPYPRNATIEEFEWDDKCMDHCIYEASEIVGKDGSLPDKGKTESILTKGKVNDKYYNAIVDAWNMCLEISGRVAKEKKFDKCKTVTHHRYCFNRKMMETLGTQEVEC